MAYFGNQLRQILRRLARTPGFTAITLITLAIGIGANTAIFSVVDGVLLKPLPYPHPEQLVGIWHTAPGVNIGQFSLGPSNYFVYRRQNRTFQDIGLYKGVSVTVTGVGEPEQVNALKVTDGTLPLLAVPPMLGRWFNRADDSPGSPVTAMLGYSYWRKEFGASRSVVGHTITVDGQPRVIIGVMPRRFQFLDWGEAAVFLPFQFDRNKVFLGNFSYDAIARLRPGVTLAAANADVGRMLPIVLRTFAPPPGFSAQLFEKAHITPNLHSLKEDVTGDVDKLLWILMGSISIVLLIACANVANLLLVRAEGRRLEVAIRTALGAGRGRIAGQLLLESAVIGLMGGVLGLALAYGALRLLVMLAPQGLPRLQEIGIDFSSLLFTFFASLLAGLLAGLIPIAKYAGARVGTGLREGGRTQSQGRERHRARSFLVVLQVGLAFVLLICSGLMIRTFRVLTHIDPGFSTPAEVQTFRLSIPEAEVRDPEAVVHMQQVIEEKLAAIPGVSSAAITSFLPMNGSNSSDFLFARDKHYAEGEMPPVRRFKYVSPGLFRTLGTPVIAGRDFTWADNYQRLPVAIISENFAREYWGSSAAALGKQVRPGPKDDWREIVGVVSDIHDDGTNHDAPTSIFCPILMNHFEGDNVVVYRTLYFVVRTSRAGSEALLKELQEAVWSVDGNLPLSEVRTLDYFYRRSIARTSFTLVMLVIAGAAGLLLGIVGLYSVIAYSVAQRRKEIGIRMALGAQREALVKMFVRQGLVLTGLGVVCGLAAAAGLTRLMRSLLFHVSTLDPMTYVGVTVVLVATAMLASYVPSRRAATVDPVETLRAE